MSRIQTFGKDDSFAQNVRIAGLDEQIGCFKLEVT